MTKQVQNSELQGVSQVTARVAELQRMSADTIVSVEVRESVQERLLELHRLSCDTGLAVEDQHEKQGRLNALHQLLDNTDHKAIQYSEGLISDEEYIPIKDRRQAWRLELRALTVLLEDDRT